MKAEQQRYIGNEGRAKGKKNLAIEASKRKSRQ